MTRIGLFIIPLAAERETEGRRNKADRKICVSEGPTLTICHGGPMVASQCIFIIAVGIKEAFSQEIYTLKPGSLTPVVTRAEKETCICLEVKICLRLNKLEQGPAIK